MAGGHGPIVPWKRVTESEWLLFEADPDDALAQLPTFVAPSSFTPLRSPLASGGRGGYGVPPTSTPGTLGAPLPLLAPVPLR